MLSLTREQEDFLRKLKIPLSLVFDATGMRPKDYRKAMRDQEKLFAIGVSPCAKHGHRMRTRSGDCMQCNPAAIGFIRRHYNKASVYIAASRSKQLIKVGSSQHPEDRETLLNSREYGGISDWSTICHVRCTNAGRVEFDIHELLLPFASPQTYTREGKIVDCLEIFPAATLAPGRHFSML